MSNTEGRVSVVTGASSGIGAATARADELGDGAPALQADVTDRGSLVAAAHAAAHQLCNERSAWRREESQPTRIAHR